jgi:hypothetical protein
MTLHDDLDPARGILAAVLFSLDLVIWGWLLIWWVTR